MWLTKLLNKLLKRGSSPDEEKQLNETKVFDEEKFQQDLQEIIKSLTKEGETIVGEDGSIIKLPPTEPDFEEIRKALKEKYGPDFYMFPDIW